MKADEALNRTLLMIILCVCVWANQECGLAQVESHPGTEVRTEGWMKYDGNFSGVGASWAEYEESCGEEDFNLSFKLKSLRGEMRVNININGPDRYAIGFVNISSVGPSNGYLLSSYILKYVGEATPSAKFAGNSTYFDPTQEYQVSIISRDGHIQVYIERIEPVSIESVRLLSMDAPMEDAPIVEAAIEAPPTSELIAPKMPVIPLVIDYRDPDPLPPGEIDFETLEGSYAHIYDVVLTCMSPTPNQPPTVTSLIRDPTTPRVDRQVGWTASAYDPEEDSIFYSFWLTGPSTDGIWELQQNWSTSNRWEWHPPQRGIYRIGVYATDGKHSAEEIINSNGSWRDGLSYVDEEPPYMGIDFKRPDPEKLVNGTAGGIYWGPVPVNQVLIVVDSNFTFENANELARLLNGSVVGKFEFIRMFQIETNRTILDGQDGLKRDIEIARNYPFVNLAFPNHQMYRESSYEPFLGDSGYEIVGVQKAWEIIEDYCSDDSNIHLFNVTVGVSDDGLYRWEKFNEFDNTSINTSINMYPFGPADLPRFLMNYSIAGSHGTGVMNILAADPDDGGLVGIASKPLRDKLNIIIINIFWPHEKFPNGIDFTTESLTALVYEIHNGSTVLSCSWGTGHPDEQMAEMYNQFVEDISVHPNCSQILFVCSAGNNGEDYVRGGTHVPGGMKLKNMITVGNIMNDGSKASDSNMNGPNFEVTLAAPGGQAVWGRNDNEVIQNIDGGTSMATPHVTAAAAIIRSIDPSLTAEDIKAVLTDEASGDKDGPVGSALNISMAVKRVIDERPNILKPENNPRPTFEDIVITSVNGGDAGATAAPESTHEVAYWDLNLNLLEGTGGETKSVNLELTRIDAVIFGRGYIAASAQNYLPASSDPRPTHDEGIESMKWWLHQDTSQPVSRSQYLAGASGSVLGSTLNMDLVSLDENVLYKLKLNLVGEGSITGSYRSYDVMGKTSSGSCYGSYSTNHGQKTTASESERGIVTIGSMDPKYSIRF